MTKQNFLCLLERKLEKLPFFSATHKITYIAGYTLSTQDEYWARYDHIWTLSQCVVNYTIINVLNNKTIILLNLAEYRLILANGLVF